MYLVSHRNESTEVLGGHLHPHRWASSTMDSSLFLVTVLCAGPAISSLVHLSLFTHCPLPLPPCCLLCPAVVAVRAQTSEASYSVPWFPAMPLFQHCFLYRECPSQSYLYLHVLPMLLTHITISLKPAMDPS